MDCYNSSYFILKCESFNNTLKKGKENVGNMEGQIVIYDFPKF